MSNWVFPRYIDFRWKSFLGEAEPRFLSAFFSRYKEFKAIDFGGEKRVYSLEIRRNWANLGAWWSSVKQKEMHCSLKKDLCIVHLYSNPQVYPPIVNDFMTTSKSRTPDLFKLSPVNTGLALFLHYKKGLRRAIERHPVTYLKEPEYDYSYEGVVRTAYQNANLKWARYAAELGFPTTWIREFEREVYNTLVEPEEDLVPSYILSNMGEALLPSFSEPVSPHWQLHWPGIPDLLENIYYYLEKSLALTTNENGPVDGSLSTLSVTAQDTKYSWLKVKVDAKKRAVSFGDKEIVEMRDMVWRLLDCLAQRPMCYSHYEDLIEILWPDDKVENTTQEAYLNRINAIAAAMRKCFRDSGIRGEFERRKSTKLHSKWPIRSSNKAFRLIIDAKHIEYISVDN